MVTSCSALRCAYRHKKGDNIGLYRFPKDQELCRRWVLALRRVNWQPKSSSRICGLHFQTGKPSKDENHPDYVPNVFDFNKSWYKRKQWKKVADQKASQRGRPSKDKNHPDYTPNVFVFNRNHNTKEHWQKVAEQKATQRVAEILHGAPKVDITGYRRIKPKLEGYGVPFVVRAMKADKQPVNPVGVDNTGNREAVEASNSNGMVSIQKEIRPSVPQGVWVLNFDSGKNSHASGENPIEMENKTAPYTSRKKSFPIPVSESVVVYEDNERFCVETSMTISDDSTLTAESSIPATEDIDEPPMTASKNVASLNVDASENVSDDSADSDYSEFKSSPFDTKEILAIKLETMLAVNISLKQKVKFYQNRCKQYETEIGNLRDIIKKTKTQTIYLS